VTASKTALERERERKQEECEKAIGHVFADRSLLVLALTHSSLRDEWTPSNERLEFLGDSVLGALVSEHLFKEHPGLAEGELTRLKSLAVSTDALVEIGKKLALASFLRVGKGIRKGRAVPRSLIANVVEALVGAIWLDAGVDVARRCVLEWFREDFERIAKTRRAPNYKAALQQAAQRQFGQHPRYVVIETSGPDHKKEFKVAARVGARDFAPAKGKTKKIAEQKAARLALRELKRDGRATAV
jgi:ribonuclease-3